MKTRIASALLALALAGCDDGRPPAGDGAVPPGMDGSTAGADGAVGSDGGPGSDGGTATDGGGTPGEDAGGTGPSASVCLVGCTTIADCNVGGPAYDEDNYRCEAGVCRYAGCNDDAECEGSFAGDYVCRDPGTGQDACVQSCATPSDCGSGTAAFDADNYGCSGGICVYEGCNDDAECASTFGASYGCLAVEPPPTPIPIPTATRNCVRRCTSPSDCGTDSGAFGEDNYACEGGACRYLGCSADAECQTSFARDSYVCR